MHVVSKSCPSSQPFLRTTHLPAAQGVIMYLPQCSMPRFHARWIHYSPWTQPPTLSVALAHLVGELLQDSPGLTHSLLSRSTCPVRHAGTLDGYARHLSIPSLSFEVFQLVSPPLPSLYLQVEASFHPSRYFSKVSERRGYKPKHASSVFD